MPAWASSQMCQSWRFVSSQKRTASSGLKPECSNDSGLNSHSHVMAVRRGPSGHSVWNIT